ncbi:MAG: NCS2 family permease [Pseudomonadota bacterium]
MSAQGSSIKTEVTAGLTTFMAMAYIVVVNPGILSETGMDFGAVFVATCLAAAFGTLVMGLVANYPVALAPGMGQNAFFAYTIVLAGGYAWQTALGAVFLSGVLFILISVFPVREWVINAIPRNLKLGISAGIGLFLATIGLQNAGIVVPSPATMVTFGDLTGFAPLAAIAGFVLIAALTFRRVPGAVLIGMLAVAAAGWLSGHAPFAGVLAEPPSVTPVLLQLDIVGALNLAMLTVVLSLLLVDVFDTAGTLVGVATRSGMIDQNGHIPRLRQALLADSSATFTGALIGTSSTTSYLESAAGVESGGRTGLTAVVVAALFLLCLLLSPLAQSVPAYASAAALLFVATAMTRAVADVEWDDMTEAAPAVITALSIPLSFSIADGIGLGFVCYALIKLCAGAGRQCPPAVYVLALLFVVKFVLL